jgi:hypothetical protein
MKLIFNIMSATSFVGVVFLISMTVYINLTKQSRIDENRKFIESVIEKQVLTQIRESMPKESGGVYVPNK